MMENHSPFEQISKISTIKSSGNIAFVGFMGTGKTTVGKILAQKCGLPFVDIDRVIVEKKGMDISSIFTKNGESYFRDLEEDILKEVLLKDCQIISCGGGSIIRESNRKLLIQRAVNCWLYNAPELSLSRINSATRPLLNEANPLEKAKQLFENRAPLYLEVADYKLCTENLSLNQISDIIYENIYLPIFG